jgi:hypothetical protein
MTFMSVDFRREHQIAWSRDEATRLRVAFGDAIVVQEHASDRELARGERLMTILDPGGRGVEGAVCVTQHSEEGSFWRIELRPVVDPKDDVPSTRAIQQLSLEMRYNMCVHATWDQTLGPRSGEDGWPDLADGVSKLIQGELRVHRRGSFGAARPERYAAYTPA